ncbi:MAG: hypothetical protein O7D91_13725 [Planctomycetota bacterium]|nr:hypothetical protein [Planctomycetota bacterium]
MPATKRLLLLTFCALGIAFAQAARADFTGMEVVDRTDLTICQDPSEPEIPFKLNVCELYAVFNNPADRLISTAFTNVSTTDPAGFYQHTLGGNHAPACAFIPLFPTLVCDSFVTLGLECDRGGSTTDPDFDSTAFNTSGEVSGGWYNSAPSNGQGDPDADNRVLFARFSYKQNKNTTGDVCIFTQLAGSKDIIEFLLLPFDCSVPTGGLPSGGESGGPNPGCIDATGSCFEVNGSAGCDCPGCCETVCDLIPSCCDDSWTQECADSASAVCDLQACEVCAEATGSCFENNGTPGCDCQECCYEICSVAPICCSEEGWDSLCALTACEQCASLCDVAPPIIFVDQSATQGANNGGSWDDAFLDLQDALELAGHCTAPVEEIWVADGTYLPSDCASTGGCTSTHRNISFELLPEITVKGGYAGSGAANPNARNFELYETILSGDLTGDDASVACTQNSPDCDAYGQLCADGFCILPANNDENSYHVVQMNFLGDLDGFTIKAGNSIGAPASPYGGGVLVGLNATLTDCKLTGNVAERGGGLYTTSSDSPTLIRCDFTGNLATSFGGGAYLRGTASLEGCWFSSNVAQDLGGGAYIFSGTSTFDDCTFSENEATNDGGGLYNRSSATVMSSRFANNSATSRGGGIFSSGFSGLTAVNCIFDGNTATTLGGAIYNSNTLTATVVNGLFFGNTAGSDGGALYNGDNIQANVVNCTFHGNESVAGQGGAIFNLLANVDLQCHSTVLWANVADGSSTETDQIAAPVGSYTVTYTTIQGLTDPGPFADGTNIGDDPSFVDAPTDDYHLAPGSPAIDHGDNTEVPFDAVDIDHDGNTGERTPLDLDHKPRFMNDPDTPDNLGVPDPGPPPIDEIVDMGAYEFRPDDCEPCPTDVDNSGDTGPFDLAILLGNWGPDITDPVVLCLDANGDFRISAFDLAVLLGNWGACP